MQKNRRGASTKSLDFPCPPTFLAHIEHARSEYSRRSQLQNIAPTDTTLKAFATKANPLRTVYYSLFNIDVKEICTLTKRHFALAIADIPYGYRLKGSTLDEHQYTYNEILHMVKSFKELTQASVWRFHNISFNESECCHSKVFEGEYTCL